MLERNPRSCNVTSASINPSIKNTRKNTNTTCRLAQQIQDDITDLVHFHHEALTRHHVEEPNYAQAECTPPLLIVVLICFVNLCLTADINLVHPTAVNRCLTTSIPVSFFRRLTTPIDFPKHSLQSPSKSMPQCQQSLPKKASHSKHLQ